MATPKSAKTAESTEELIETVKENLPEKEETKELTPEESAAAIKARIEELKADRVKNHSAEAVKAIINQLPKEKTASERGTPIMEYAARVMASQSPDITVVPVMLGIAKTRKALKKQGYALEDIEEVIDQLEKAYED